MTLEELRRVPWREITSVHMDALRAVFGGRCKKCKAKRSRLRFGKTAPLEFAHTKPTGLCGRSRGLKNRFIDVLRNLDCYELLCRRCHVTFDMAHWIDRALAVAPPATVEEEAVPF